MQSYDAIFISNVAAGDLGTDLQKLLESAVRDFGVGLVCVGGDQTYAAGGYRGTPLEATLPVDMELGSKKVLPSGAVALVMHGMEFTNGNQVARDCALGVLAGARAAGRNGRGALGRHRALALSDDQGRGRKRAGPTNRRDEPGRLAELSRGDEHGARGLEEIDCQPEAHGRVQRWRSRRAPTQALMQAIVGDRITVSTVLISGHAGPETMISIADQGKGRFYNVTSPNELPQIFIKEAAVILKSAIYEEPFKPQVRLPAK